MSGHITRERALLVGFSAVAFGVAALLRKFSINRIHPFQFETVSGVFHIVTGLFYFWLSMTYVNQSWDSKGIGYAVLQCFLNGLGALAFMFALRGGNDVGVISTLVGVSPIITLMLSAALLGEQPGMKSMIGILLVVIGVVIASWR